MVQYGDTLKGTCCILDSFYEKMYDVLVPRRCGGGAGCCRGVMLV